MVSAACLAAEEEAPKSPFEQKLESLAKSPLVSTLDVTEPEPPESGNNTGEKSP